jgi:glutamine synthetase
MGTDYGENMLAPGAAPDKNLRFLATLAVVIRAVDLHQDLIRGSIASPGNDYRLGANEAPPGIISVFLGEQLESVCQDVMAGREHAPFAKATMNTGARNLAQVPRDAGDRNRTSPFAFTGNKFEFRAVGASQTMDISTTTLNTICAESFAWLAAEITARLAQRGAGANKEGVIREVVVETLKKHYRIVFNGNGYSKEWEEEAGRRGLLNIKNGPDALACYDSADNAALFESMRVLSKAEFAARAHIYSENYLKFLNIEVRTLQDMVATRVLPACHKQQTELAGTVVTLEAALGKGHSLVAPLSARLIRVSELVARLSALVEASPTVEHGHGQTARQALKAFHTRALASNAAIRECCDELEGLVEHKHWPFPKYSELLFKHD